MTPRTRRLIRALEKAALTNSIGVIPPPMLGSQRRVAARALRWALRLYAYGTSGRWNRSGAQCLGDADDALRDAINALEGRDGR